MAAIKTPSTDPAPRATAVRRGVLDAAERLLRSGSAEFSMRELAAEAGVSFATPFNHFGSKAAIMHALSTRRIDTAKPGGDAVDRVLAAVDIAATVMLAEPRVNRAVIATIGAPGGKPGQVYVQSRTLWTKAIGDGEGFDPDSIDLIQTILPGQLAVTFRGVLSFWTADEIGDVDLMRHARRAASVSLLGFVGGRRRITILTDIGAV